MARPHPDVPGSTTAAGSAPSPAVAARAPARGGRGSRRAWLVPAALLALVVVAWLAVPEFRAFAREAWAVLGSGDRARTEQWVRGFGAWGPLALLVLYVAQTVIPVIPSVLLMVVTVLAYGPLAGGALTFGGLLLAAGVAYGLGRALGPATVARLIGARTERRIEEFVHHYGAWAVVVARISPLVSTDAVSFVAGLVGMGPARFLAATAAGTLPLTALVAWLGGGVDRLQAGLAWVSILSLAAFLAYVAIDRRRRTAAARRAQAAATT